MSLEGVFNSLQQYVDSSTTIVQLVAFANPEIHLRKYLDAMRSAYYEELIPFMTSKFKRPVRQVPNRKWYTATYKDRNLYAGTEVLLFHKLIGH